MGQVYLSLDRWESTSGTAHWPVDMVPACCWSLASRTHHRHSPRLLVARSPKHAGDQACPPTQ